mmetsp:Transcript_122/g.262  ORF Transcript_122/g.262 Transcript_122/m.262 type:complete len:216 (-) Transcript_122:894-1541(-)
MATACTGNASNKPPIIQQTADFPGPWPATSLPACLPPCLLPPRHPACPQRLSGWPQQPYRGLLRCCTLLRRRPLLVDGQRDGLGVALVVPHIQVVALAGRHCGRLGGRQRLAERRARLHLLLRRLRVVAGQPAVSRLQHVQRAAQLVALLEHPPHVRAARQLAQQLQRGRARVTRLLARVPQQHQHWGQQTHVHHRLGVRPVLRDHVLCEAQRLA